MHHINFYFSSELIVLVCVQCIKSDSDINSAFNNELNNCSSYKEVDDVYKYVNDIV
jgi:hypothetical protein